MCLLKIFSVSKYKSLTRCFDLNVKAGFKPAFYFILTPVYIHGILLFKRIGLILYFNISVDWPFRM